ncbi:spore cortex biosynthesis protein YabQ [Halobacillus fulvus]|nr:spore cortex biosynthesis protein YabQ [Halobacillus fulvus]
MTLTTQFVTILSMMGGGMIVGASLDAFERFFRRRNKKSWLEIIYQLGFWLTQACMLFYILYLANYGELRLYVFLAVVCGFAAYRALFRGPFLRGLEVGIRVVTSVLRALRKIGYNLLIRPIQSIFFLIFALLTGIYALFLKSIYYLFLVIIYPIRLIFRLLWRLLPKNAKKSLRYVAGFLGKMKNTKTIWNKFRK